jgi:hypothetical protein
VESNRGKLGVILCKQKKEMLINHHRNTSSGWIQLGDRMLFPNHVPTLLFLEGHLKHTVPAHFDLYSLSLTIP